MTQAQDQSFSFGGGSVHSPFESLLNFSTPAAFNSSHGIIGTPFLDTQEWDGKQALPDDCAIRSQQFILEQFTGEKFDEFSLVQEAKDAGIYTPGVGTYACDVGNLLEIHGIGVHHHDNATVADLADELAQGHKVMVGVDAEKLWGDMPDGIAGHEDHSIVVSGIDTTNPDDIKVIVNDPGTGNVATYPMDHFLASWSDGGFPMVATNDPAPANTPGMAHFDYTAGHILDVAGIPYNEFHQFHDQPDFLARFITLLHDVVEKVADDLFSGGHHSSHPPTHVAPIDPIPSDHGQNDHGAADDPATTHFISDIHPVPAAVPPYFNFHENTIIQPPTMSMSSPFIVNTYEPVPHFPTPQTSEVWLPSEVAPESISLIHGQTDSSDPTAPTISPESPMPPSPEILYEPNSLSQNGFPGSVYSPSSFPSSGTDSPPSHTPWDDHLADWPSADPILDGEHLLPNISASPSPDVTAADISAPENFSDSIDFTNSPTSNFPVIDTHSLMLEAPPQSWSQLGDFPDDCHTAIDNTQEIYQGTFPADGDLYDHFTV